MGGEKKNPQIPLPIYVDVAALLFPFVYTHKRKHVEKEIFKFATINLILIELSFSLFFPQHTTTMTCANV